MTWQEIADSWDRLRQSLRDRWEEFTEDDISTVRGRKEHIVELLMRKYGLDRAAAERDAEAWRESLSNREP